MLVLLLSPAIGIAAEGKPDQPPGKPSPPEPETFTYQIWIEIGDLNGEGA